MRLLCIIGVFFAGAALGCTLPSSDPEVVPYKTTPLSQNNAQTTSVNLEITSTPEYATSESQDTLTPNPANEGVDGSVGPCIFPENITPLTGLIVADLVTLMRRPIVVKISNAPSIVRPQAGIGAADIVFEHYVEGGLTRFSAIFYSRAPERVGSIRSARLIDHEIVPMFDGMLAFSGASIGIEKYIYGSEAVAARIEGANTVPPGGLVPPSEYVERAYKGVLYGRPYYWRDEDILVPHNMFVNLAALWELAVSEEHAQRPRLQGLAFRTAPSHDSTGLVDVVDLRYRATRVRWEYDPSVGLYWRYADGQAHLDANTQMQITAANVVVLYAEHSDTDIVESEWQGNISWSTQIAVWGENAAILFRDGQRFDGYWTRTVREDIISLRTAEGDVLYLKPGNTWLQVVRSPEQQTPQSEWLIVE